MSRFGLDPPTVPPGCTFVGTTPPQASSTGPATYWVVQATTKYVDAGMTSSSCRWDFASLSDTAYLTRCEWAFVDQVGRNDGCPQASRNACEATAVANNCCVENLDPAVAQANDCDGSACRADCVPHPFISSLGLLCCGSSVRGRAHLSLVSRDDAKQACLPLLLQDRSRRGVLLGEAIVSTVNGLSAGELRNKVLQKAATAPSHCRGLSCFSSSPDWRHEQQNAPGLVRRPSIHSVGSAPSAGS
jgi:hypothetical protein